jgi:hypothetical protein
MVRFHIGFLFVVALCQTVSCVVWGGSVAGITRTDGEPLETGPFNSEVTSAGSEIAHTFQSMYLTALPNTWTKTFRWQIPGNTGLAPGQKLTIMESIPLIYRQGTNASVQLPISDWHETIVNGDLSEFFQWDSQYANTNISAHIDSETLTIHPNITFSIDSKSVWFDFDPIQIPTQSAASGSPVILDILKQIRWTGPVLDPLPTSHYIDVLVSEYPSTVRSAGDFNGNGTVDAADYAIWRIGLGTTYMQSDFDVWRAHFGETIGSGSGINTNAAVPEPSTLVLLMFAAAGWSLRRSRFT